jgi:hypothetical protein
VRSKLLVAIGTLLGSFTLAGCLGDSGEQAPDPAQPASALSHRDVADEAARAWNEEAELVSVAGGEGALEALVSEGSLRFLPTFVNGTQAQLGDGQSSAWAFEYRAGDQGYGVVVEANGTISTEQETPLGSDRPVGDDLVDSTTAIDRLQAQSEAFGEGQTPRAFAYALYNATEHDGSVWALGKLSGNEPTVGLIDADTGDFLGIVEDGRDPITPQGRVIGPQQPPRVADEGSGQADATNDADAWAIFLQGDNHPNLGFRLVAEEPVTGVLNATLMRDGRSLTSIEVDAVESEARGEWPRPRSGDFVIEVDLEQGASQAYTVQWCAPGRDDGDPKNEACSEPGPEEEVEVATGTDGLGPESRGPAGSRGG